MPDGYTKQPDIRDLKRKRAQLIDSMRAISERAQSSARDLTAAEAAEHKDAFSAASQLATEIERLEASRAGNALAESRDDPRFAAALAGYSLRRAIISGIPDLARTTDCGRETEIAQELARRSPIKPKGMLVPLDFVLPRTQYEPRVVTTLLPAAGPGGLIIPTDYRPDLFIDLLRSLLIVRGLGATTLMSLQGDVEIPALKKSVTFGWVAENTALASSDQEYRSVTLAPKHAGGLTEVSRNLLQQASPDVERLVAMDFAAVLAAGLDAAAIAGTGVAPEPRGILNTTGIGDVIAAGTPTQPTWSDVIDLIAAVDAANATGSGFACHPKVRALLRKTPRVASTDSAMIQEAPDSLAGYREAVSTVVPDSALIFGNWSDLLIGVWSAFDLLVNPYLTGAYEKGNVSLRGMMTVDVAVRHAASFAACKNIAYV